MPLERKPVIGEIVGRTSHKHEESEMWKKVEFAPESDITGVLGEGVLGDRREAKRAVELSTTADVTLIDDMGSPNTRIPYFGFTHL